MGKKKNPTANHKKYTFHGKMEYFHRKKLNCEDFVRNTSDSSNLKVEVFRNTMQTSAYMPSLHNARFA